MDSLSQHLPPLAGSPTASRQVAIPSETTCSPSVASRKAAQLLGLYRKDECADPETFATGAAAILARYTVEVVSIVTDPRTGLPGTLKWLPSLSEIRDACEREQRRVEGERERAANRLAQMRLEREIAAERAAPGYDLKLARRKEFIARTREEIASFMAAGDPKSGDVADARKCQDPAQREQVASVIMRDLQAKRERNASTPCVLSDAARATMGLPPRRVAEAAE